MAQASRKARKKSTSRRAQAVPGWVWLLTGLAIGLSIALYTAMKDRAKQPPAPTLNNSPAPAVSPKQDRAKANAKAEDKKSAKPRFDFYTILPEMEVIVPDTRNKAGQAASVDKPGTYFLQVGSFRSYGEADNLKAQLALLGVESKIEAVTSNNNETWHRVRVGPYQDLRELNKIRTRLLNNNISAILLRVNG
jgi:cell division protein FtsN